MIQLPFLGLSNLTPPLPPKGTLTRLMDDRTRNGYARLVRNLAELDHHDRFQKMLNQAYGTMDELGRLIERVKQLSDEHDEGKPPT